MSKSRLRDTAGVNQIQLEKFAAQEDAQIRNQAIDYYYCHRYDLSDVVELSTVSTKMYWGFHNPYRGNLRHRFKTRYSEAISSCGTGNSENR